MLNTLYHNYHNPVLKKIHLLKVPDVREATRAGGQGLRQEAQAWSRLLPLLHQAGGIRTSGQEDSNRRAHREQTQAQHST